MPGATDPYSVASVVVPLPLAIVLVLACAIVTAVVAIVWLRHMGHGKRLSALEAAQAAAAARDAHFDHKLSSIQTDVKNMTELLHVIIKGHMARE
ncbi:hypothetical protein [Neokomagataea anthophila]|uniref:Uncharacterized protein n=1 Tax=Neokomagataea anthophila TaxID=2826925 RepID=A0ABS5E6I8_9PROT|nr:hypothetical protein [Neokomagataea anthophila]MBR0559514.1 hypothetical protein [Neokomagataea anthophila]